MILVDRKYIFENQCNSCSFRRVDSQIIGDSFDMSEFIEPKLSGSYHMRISEVR